MLTCGIGGNFLAIIQNMYADVSYCVKLDKGLTENIPSNSGVKQGCVLSPLLFNLFLHDFPDIFDDECDPVLCGTLKMNCLMFADDLVLFSESAPGLQNCLNKLNTYMKKWNLKVNINKTKVVVFNKGGKKLKHLYFYLGTEEIENVQNYCYLGIIFHASGSFSNACINIADKAMKAFFKLKQINPRENALLTLKLFDSLVTPILMYGCEVWGPLALRKIDKSDFKLLCDSFHVEKINIKLSKYVLGVSRCATNAAVMGELGRFPIAIRIVKHAFNYLKIICNLSENSVVKVSYTDSITTDRCTPVEKNWAACVKGVLLNFDGQLQWEQQRCSLSAYDLNSAMCNKYESSWLDLINKNVNNKLRTYSKFKNKFRMENYILQNQLSRRRNFTKIRISCHPLAIETGRYTMPKTPVENRICLFCNLNAIEDEYHVLMECENYNQERMKFFSCVSEISILEQSSDYDTFLHIMNYLGGDVEFSKITCDFVSQCLEKRKELSLK